MFSNLIEFQKVFSTEIKCIKYLEKLRYKGEKPTCPRCKKDDKSYKFSKPGLYACGHCKREFSIRKGTIFEDSPLKLTKWFMAFYFEISSPKAISSVQLAKNIGTTQKTAWFVQQRVRWALKNNTIEKMTGDVEVDETYVGGSESNKHASRTLKRKGMDSKMVVVGALERKKQLAMKYINKTNIKNIKPILDKYIELEEAKLFTDESPVYKGYERKTTNHSKGEYVKGEAHTNSIEGTFSLFKRRIYGIHHQITKQHIEKYITSFVFYFNNKGLEIADRFENAMFSMFSNNNLTYNVLTGKEVDLRRYRAI